MIHPQIRHHLKLLTSLLTFLGVSCIFVSQTVAGEVLPQAQNQKPFPEASPKFQSTFLNDQNLTQPQIPLSLDSPPVQPMPKPTTIWAVERFVQETQSNPNPFTIIDDSERRVQENQSDGNPFIIRADSDRRGGKNIEEILESSFSTFYELLKLAKADLKDILVEENKNIIVFAPTNDALAALGEQMTQLYKPENREQLRQLLRNHIVVGGISEAQLQQGSVQTLGGETIQIQQLDNNETDVNGIKILNNEDFIQAVQQESIIIEMDQLLFEPEL